MAHTPARSTRIEAARIAGPTPRHVRRGWASSALRDTPSVVEALDAQREARGTGGGTAVNPALARMHERLRARRPLGAADVPAVADVKAGVPAVRAAVTAAPRADASTTDAPASDTPASDAPASDTSATTPAVERFMRLRGRSGRTYVFSRIEPRHVSLYRNGIFAWVEKGAAQARVIGEVLPIVSNAIDDGALYVHLLAQDDGDRAEVLADLD